MQVNGYPGTLSAAGIRATVLHTALSATGSFHSDNPQLNRLQAAIVATVTANFHSIPTDCPTRLCFLGQLLLSFSPFVFA